jgi:hypothetical protein
MNVPYNTAIPLGSIYWFFVCHLLIPGFSDRNPSYTVGRQCDVRVYFCRYSVSSRSTMPFSNHTDWHRAELQSLQTILNLRTIVKRGVTTASQRTIRLKDAARFVPTRKEQCSLRALTNYLPIA